MKMMDVNMKKELLYSEGCGDIGSRSVDDFVKYLKEIKGRYKKSWKNITVEFEDEWGYYDDHWIEMKIYGERKKCLSKKSK